MKFGDHLFRIGLIPILANYLICLRVNQSTKQFPFVLVHILVLLIDQVQSTDFLILNQLSYFSHYYTDGQLPFQFNPKKAPNSSLKILPYSLQKDRFYQFFVRLVHRRRANFTAEGSVIVNVTDTPREKVSATCVISSSIDES